MPSSSSRASRSTRSTTTGSAPTSAVGVAGTECGEAPPEPGGSSREDDGEEAPDAGGGFASPRGDAADLRPAPWWLLLAPPPPPPLREPLGERGAAPGVPPVERRCPRARGGRLGDGSDMGSWREEPGLAPTPPPGDPCGDGAPPTPPGPRALRRGSSGGPRPKTEGLGPWGEPPAELRKGGPSWKLSTGSAHASSCCGEAHAWGTSGRTCVTGRSPTLALTNGGGLCTTAFALLFLWAR